MTDMIDGLFDGDLLIGHPELDAEYARKAPGDQDGDNRGDHCAS
ncbi:MAG TPA: hypothetical protein VGD67_20100 [Pseudonocardiaceae bacterium]